MSEWKNGSPRATLAFVQAMLVAPRGMRIVLPPLDDVGFHVVCQTMGAEAERRIVKDRSRERVCDQVTWEIDGHRFVARSYWREPSWRDLERYADQGERNDEEGI